jgi:predicted nucleic acid-binding Zn ribbon protein
MDKQDNIILLKEILDKFFKNKDFSSKLSMHIIKKNWQKIVGNQLFKQIEPDKIEKETLIIKCHHQGWITTLSFYKDSIIKKVNDELKDKGNINDIRVIFKKS